ncbi:hypothetical protein [Pseudooceanicola sp. HF7]|uniref:hypothetical protein n=1 Tax=Pseudooceanicola sp. HF7 TaxID=2721560 RepID=UPI0014316C00|nr:hypothetical protein [Pseudooceanicola sp. HF7]NIZ10168.1 hypothetical protein [Pseudooceanicola sp. HF7]
MKLTTLAKRLAERSGEPLLEQIALGNKPLEDLGPDCLPWTGTSRGNSNTPRATKRRGRDNLPYLEIRSDLPVGVIQYNGKEHRVPRLLIQLTQQPSVEFRLQQTCSTPLCVNPHHFEVIQLNREVPQHDPEGVPDFSFGTTDEVTVEEVEELVEILLDEHMPATWTDVISNTLMEDLPPEMIRDVLKSLNKEHLT